MLDFFKDAPAYAWMTESAREEGRKEARRQIEQALQQTVKAQEGLRNTTVQLGRAALSSLFVSLAK
jgi:hypothetical protein